MKLFVGLFGGLVLLQMGLFFIVGSSRGDHPLVDFLVLPAFWVGMATSRAHSPWFLMYFIGIGITALLYALVLWTIGLVARKVVRKERVPKF